MTIHTTYTQARDGLAKLLDQVTHNREVVVIQRRGEEEVAMIAAWEFESLMETAYLLRSPANAERLLTALGRALKGEGEAQTIAVLRNEVGLEPYRAVCGILTRIHRRFTLLGRNGSQTGTKSLRHDRGNFA